VADVTHLFLDSHLCHGYGIAFVNPRRGAGAATRAPQARRSPESAEYALPDSVPPHLGAEWDAISCGRRNVLLAGAPSAVDALLASLRPYLEEPIRDLNADTGTPLPARGTLILPEIGGLDADQQLQLLTWMEQAAHSGDRAAQQVQIVSTTSRPMLPLIENGEFRAELYYRLNVVRIDLDEPGTDLNA
jgi:hypothetical protein